MAWEQEAKKEREIYLRRAIVQELCKTPMMSKKDIIARIGCRGYEAMLILHMLCEDGVLEYELEYNGGDDWFRRYYIKG
jgi:hypothetical protein